MKSLSIVFFALLSVSAVLASEPAVNGVCAPVHFGCVSGVANNFTNFADTNWAWVCGGSGGGSDASCNEVKANVGGQLPSDVPGSHSAPPTPKYLFGRTWTLEFSNVQATDANGTRSVAVSPLTLSVFSMAPTSDRGVKYGGMIVYFVPTSSVFITMPGSGEQRTLKLEIRFNDPGFSGAGEPDVVGFIRILANDYYLGSAIASLGGVVYKGDAVMREYIPH